MKTLNKDFVNSTERMWDITGDVYYLKSGDYLQAIPVFKGYLKYVHKLRNIEVKKNLLNGCIDTDKNH